LDAAGFFLPFAGAAGFAGVVAVVLVGVGVVLGVVWLAASSVPTGCDTHLIEPGTTGAWRPA
jgi:hypothetical protein